MQIVLFMRYYDQFLSVKFHQRTPKDTDSEPYIYIQICEAN